MAGRALLDETARRFPFWPSDVPPEGLLRFYFTHTATQVAAPATLVDLVAVVRSWRPDVVVHDPAEFAGPIAAAWAGIPGVNHGWGPLLPLEEYHLAGEMVAPLWKRIGVEPATPGGMFDHLYIDICPPGLQTAEVGDLDAHQALRPLPVHLRLGRHPDEVGPLPPWVQHLDALPLVYATLGTVFNNTPGLFAAIAEGLGDLEVNAVLAVGLDGDPAAVAGPPTRIHVEGYVPQSLVLPRCHVVICHGGAGTILAAMDAGVPVLCLPVGLDQFHNARRCEAAGVGRWLARSEVGPAAIRREIRILLGEPNYQLRARDLQGEVRSMPGAGEVVDRLQGLISAAR